MKKVYQNPFITSGYHSAKYFCDRTSETETLCQLIINGQNVVLTGPRRVGKTGLVQHCFRQSKLKSHAQTFFIDIYATGNLREMAFVVGKQIFETLKDRDKKQIDAFFHLIPSFRQAYKLDSQSGEPIFDMGIGEITRPEQTLEQIFSFLESTEKPSVVAIDEFQQVDQYSEPNVEAFLRTLVQQCARTRFIFSGSRRQTLQSIFFSPSRPFYQSASLLSLAPIPVKKYTTFIRKHFTQAGKIISDQQIGYIYKLFEGHTWYIQCYFNRLYALLPQNESPSNSMMEDCLVNTIALYESMFQGVLFLLPDRQKELLYAIAREGKAKEIMSAAFVKKHALLSPSSVQTSARQLLEKDFIDTENHVYQIANRFFGLWLSHEYGRGYQWQLSY
jgi:Predicted ATPase (AAA+ superfamily)